MKQPDLTCIRERVTVPFWRTGRVRRAIQKSLGRHPAVHLTLGPVSGFFMKSFDMQLEMPDNPFLAQMLAAAFVVAKTCA